jgi:hypothetical protein
LALFSSVTWCSGKTTKMRVISRANRFEDSASRRSNVGALAKGNTLASFWCPSPVGSRITQGHRLGGASPSSIAKLFFDFLFCVDRNSTELFRELGLLFFVFYFVALAFIHLDKIHASIERKRNASFFGTAHRDDRFRRS